MSRLGINTGSNPNDGQGDPLRIAMGKINSNFTEIYSTFGDGSNLDSIPNVAENLTGNPIINVSGILNTGITTTEHLEVRNITSTGIVTAVQFVGDGSQLSNVTALVGGLEVLDNDVRRGIARELNFGDNITSTGPDGVGRVTISVGSGLTVAYSPTSGVANYALLSGVSTTAGYATTSGYSVLSGVSGYATTSGISTVASVAGVSTSVIGGIGSITSLSVSGVTTTARLNVGTGGTVITTTATGLVGIGTTSPVDGYNLTVGSNGIHIKTGGTLNIGSPGYFTLSEPTTGSGRISASPYLNLKSGWGGYTLLDNPNGNMGVFYQGGAVELYYAEVKKFQTSSSGVTVTGTTQTDNLSVGTGGTVITTTAVGSVGIGTTQPTAGVDIRTDLRVGINTSQGLILTSPGGTKFRLVVDNAGTLSTVIVP